MCWNREVSLFSGITASALSTYLLFYGKRPNDLPIALVSLAIALMQFAEVFLWEAVETGHNTGTGGRLGILALFLQPLALTVGIAISHGNSSITVLSCIIGIWAIFALPTLYRLLSPIWPVQPGKCGHLQWSFLEPMLRSPFAILYWCVMLGGWLFLRPFQEGLQYSLLAISTLTLTWWYFPGEWGTMWCFLANLLPLGRILRL